VLRILQKKNYSPCDFSVSLRDIIVSFSGFGTTRSGAQFAFDFRIPSRIMFNWNVKSPNEAEVKAAFNQLVVSCMKEGATDPVFSLLLDHFDVEGTAGDKWRLNGVLKVVNVMANLSNLLLFIPVAQSVTSSMLKATGMSRLQSL